MPNLQFTYSAQRFKPRAGSDQELLLFVAPATDIRTWAGVPRKAFDYQHGFQRTLNPGRVGDVSRYFGEDQRNISPTSIVVGFTGSVLIDDAADGSGFTRVQICLPDFTALSLTDLADLALAELRARLGEDLATDIEQNADVAFAEAVRLQDEEAVDESFGIDDDSETSGTNGMDQGAESRSYLGDFYAQLLGYRNEIQPWPDEAELREVLYSLLRPAIIVDGQHRVFGGAHADAEMLFAVCAIPNSSWAESVYQFVVINQKAKPIKPAFLSSIIATSLNVDEIATVYDRLRTSKIDVERAEIMDRVETDPASPFRGMIDFEVERSPGFLQFPGMSRLVKDFQNIPRSHSGLLPDGEWLNVEGEWIEHFFAFWRGIRTYFEGQDARLWQKPSADTPNNLLKIVTLQEVQGLMLDLWADSRLFTFQSVAATEIAAANFWSDFPSTFFSDEWRLKGLQTSVGRRMLKESMLETRRNIGRRNWGHRRLKLFSD